MKISLRNMFGIMTYAAISFTLISRPLANILIDEPLKNVLLQITVMPLYPILWVLRLESLILFVNPQDLAEIFNSQRMIAPLCCCGYAIIVLFISLFTYGGIITQLGAFIHNMFFPEDN